MAALRIRIHAKAGEARIMSQFAFTRSLFSRESVISRQILPLSSTS
jgi:hypothetical protein